MFFLTWFILFFFFFKTCFFLNPAMLFEPLLVFFDMENKVVFFQETVWYKAQPKRQNKYSECSSVI